MLLLIGSNQGTIYHDMCPYFYSWQKNNFGSGRKSDTVQKSRFTCWRLLCLPRGRGLDGKRHWGFRCQTCYDSHSEFNEITVVTGCGDHMGPFSRNLLFLNVFLYRKGVLKWNYVSTCVRPYQFKPVKIGIKMCHH